MQPMARDQELNLVWRTTVSALGAFTPPTEPPRAQVVTY